MGVFLTLRSHSHENVIVFHAVYCVKCILSKDDSGWQIRTKSYYR